MAERRRRGMLEEGAPSEAERVVREFQEAFRVTGVNPALVTLARTGHVFAQAWDALRPNIETRAFEEAADEVRRQAVYAAVRLPRIEALAQTSLDEADRYQLESALDLYHYMDPKLLVFVAALRRALTGQLPGPVVVMSDARSQEAERLPGGAPPGMQAVDLAPEHMQGLHDRRMRPLYEDIVATMNLGGVDDGDVRTLVLWPDYLERAWQRLKPLVQTSDYVAAASRLRDLARSVATSLPYAVDLRREQFSLGAESDTYDELWDAARALERLLPSLTLAVALLQLDRADPELVAGSPFPPAPRLGADQE